MAFVMARGRFKPSKGVFEHYGKASIRNALLIARRAERKHWNHRQEPEDGYDVDAMVSLSVGHELALKNVDEAVQAQCIQSWADALPPNLAQLWQGLYARDLSQREFAVEAGVSQARVSQRTHSSLRVPALNSN